MSSKSRQSSESNCQSDSSISNDFNPVERHAEDAVRDLGIEESISQVESNVEEYLEDHVGENECQSVVEPSQLRRDTFLSSVYLLLGLTILQKGLGFVRSVVICRNLSPEQMGQWSMTLTFMETVSPLLILSIPACFGRYFEKYESKRQLKGFIRQSVIVISLCFVTGLGVLFLFRTPIARFIYADSYYTPMLMTGLVVVIPYAIFGVVASILTGLRKSQTRTISEFVSGTMFTLLAVTLVALGGADAYTIAYSFAGAYCIASLFSLLRVRGFYRQLDEDQQPLVWRGTWLRLAPIIVVFWMTDFLTNLFSTIDRYMIINLSPVQFGDPLQQVGNYEAAHVIPLLLSAFMAIVAKVLLPYLSNDWESGNKKLVADKINLSVKLGGIALIAGSTMILWVSGFLFETLFNNKYEGGFQVLPLVIFFYVGIAMSFLLLNYFWCCEKGKYAIFALLAGLVANVITNSILIGTYGIQGAAVGTVVAVATQFLILWVAAWSNGLRADWRTPLIFVAGSVLLISPQVALIGFAAILVFAVSGLMFSPEERAILLRRNA